MERTLEDQAREILSLKVDGTEVTERYTEATISKGIKLIPQVREIAKTGLNIDLNYDPLLTNDTDGRINFYWHPLNRSGSFMMQVRPNGEVVYAGNNKTGGEISGVIH